MNASEFTPEKVREWLEYAPAARGGAPDLLGFVVGEWFYCRSCCSRLHGRGILLPVGSRALWDGQVRDGEQEARECSACGHFGRTA